MKKVYESHISVSVNKVIGTQAHSCVSMLLCFNDRAVRTEEVWPSKAKTVTLTLQKTTLVDEADNIHRNGRTCISGRMVRKEKRQHGRKGGWKGERRQCGKGRPPSLSRDPNDKELLGRGTRDQRLAVETASAKALRQGRSGKGAC